MSLAWSARKNLRLSANVLLEYKFQGCEWGVEKWKQIPTWLSLHEEPELAIQPPQRFLFRNTMLQNTRQKGVRVSLFARSLPLLPSVSQSLSSLGSEMLNVEAVEGGGGSSVVHRVTHTTLALGIPPVESPCCVTPAWDILFSPVPGFD